MRILLDTCALLWLGNGQKVSSKATEVLNKSNDVSVSPFSAWEIGNLVSLGRISLSQAPDRWFSGIVKNSGLNIAELTSDLLVFSNFLPGPIHKDPADRIIIATAREYGMTILTRDQKILDYADQGHVNALRC